MQVSDDSHQEERTRVSFRASLRMAAAAVYTELICAVWSEVIFCHFGHIDAYKSTWSNDAQRGAGGQFVP